MSRYEYKVVPAPTKGLKAKGVRKAEDRFSHTLQELMNSLSSEGWDYQRAETLPSTERSGLTGSTVEWRNVLVFRRPQAGDMSDFKPELLPAPEIASEKLPDKVAERPLSKPKETAETAPKPAQNSKDFDVIDNGVEETVDSGGLIAVKALAAIRNLPKP